ncbi:ABC transporter substrate-binding protein [Limobrevibacterium gyesilva]|uniref:ABC transporter substrate-binding protein n=1 Tax=Limobrevibacterium gyesilva TaxID=2991712 RepID=A0AA41YSU6_9PROT|nr:ABC transporter substrate-binding protein [Limobrevibacterium gyesilva]MCW3475943.1 ABC transporter substrate-binding protein [Limobrevibacterium gyesilva]
MVVRYQAAMRGAVVAGCLVGAAAMNGAAAQTLTMASSAPITSVDPHYHTFTPNASLDAHLFDSLLDMDAQSRPVAALAESWKLVDERTWELKLRQGVKFHNGAAFTAEDVAYTLDRVPRVPNSPGSFAIYTKPIVGVEIVDPHTIRLRTAGIYPLVPIDLTQVAIIPHGLGKDPATEDFNSGKNAIGTGPFRFVSYKPGDRVEMDRFDGYWGKKPYWQHVSFRIIPNDGARTAALLSGDIGFIEAVPTTDAARLRTDKRVHLAETVSLRIIFLTLDQSRDGPTPFITGPNGEKLDRNPLKDHRVREALSIAINRPAIVERVMEGAAIPAGQFLPPGSYSYAPDLPPPAYDAARAKKLLAEAGFPNGFRITLHGPNDRYVNDAKIIQSIGQMWTRIGVQTSVEGITWSNYIARANKQEFSAYLLGWGSSSGEASNPLRSLVATFDAAKGRGAVNRGRYSNPQLDALIDKAVTTADDAAREKVLQQATKLAMDDVAFIPLHNQKNIWGMRSDLTYIARADEQSRAQDVRPVQ